MLLKRVMKVKKNKLKTKAKDLIKFSKKMNEEKIAKIIDLDKKAHIAVCLKEEVIENRFSEQLTINDDFYEYIEKNAKIVPFQYPIVLDINNCQSQIAGEEIKTIIINHYLLNLLEKRKELKRNKLISIFLFVIGIILYSFYFVYEYFHPEQMLFNEIFSISATFCIWETVDYALIMRGEIRNAFLFNVRMVESTINIINQDETKE